jgi:hypothetical protein
MTRVDDKIETCPCRVCRSDLAYIVPCLTKETADDPGRVLIPVAAEPSPVVAVFPIPLMM